uniref:Uncharacterized protein n=1 Tax=Acrobeloides nanus TaxID=290746 RepID=A0A914CG06_9BILA
MYSYSFAIFNSNTYSYSKYSNTYSYSENPAGNLAKYMFFKKCKETKADRTVEFLKYAGQLYNPAKNEPPIPQDFSDGEDDEITFPDELDG